jgi:hypothetical protein
MDERAYSLYLREFLDQGPARFASSACDANHISQKPFAFKEFVIPFFAKCIIPV